MSRWRACLSKLTALVALLSTGILPYHQSCSVTAQNAVTAGVSNFLAGLTEDALNAVFRPGATGSGNNSTGGQNNTDPFAPPSQT